MSEKPKCEICGDTGFIFPDDDIADSVHYTTMPCDCTKKEDFDYDLNNLDA